MNPERYLHKDLIFLLILLGIPSLLSAQKPFYESRSREIDNLKKERIYNSAAAQVSESGAYRFLYNISSGPSVKDPETAAREFIAKQSSLLSIQNAGKELILRSIARSPGGQHVSFYQTLDGYPVYNSSTVVTLNNENRITFVASRYQPGLNLRTTVPVISSSEAISIAKRYLDVKGKMIIKPGTELIVFESRTEGTLLVYRTVIVTDEPMGDWEVMVNSENGAIVNVRDLMRYHDGRKANGRGSVFPPDPLRKAKVFYGGQFTDPEGGDADNPSINAQREIVELKDITLEDGLYKLKGPYAVLEDIENPADNFPQLKDPGGFNFTRAQQEFEAVNVYYNIDKAYRWLLALGFNIPGLLQFRADPHGLNGRDNSHYSISGNYCAWGEGGVDDAEDGAIIWHEYAHAIQDNIVAGGMSYSGETMSLQEGCSDYWAASHNRSENPFSWGQVFLWDSGIRSEADRQGTFWSGRRCNLNWVYPQNFVQGYDGGQLWSSVLMKIWEELGREVTDRLFIQAHYLWGQSPDLKAAAQAFIQADRDLYNGSHLSTIIYWFHNRGLADESDFLPAITHTPLRDTEDTADPHIIKAIVTRSANPLNPDKIKVVFGKDSAPQDTLTMTSIGKEDEYAAYIPGEGRSAAYNYYIFAADSAGSIVYYPSGAPTKTISFYAGPDTVKPAVTHSRLNNQLLSAWPANVKAFVTDNIGVDTVYIEYIMNKNISGKFGLRNSGSGIYEGLFNINAACGDSVRYRLVAVDKSSSRNIKIMPGTGYYNFSIISSRGKVLVLNDNPDNTKTEDEKGIIIYEGKTAAEGAENIAGYLSNIGFITDIIPFVEAAGADFNNYNFVILASGINSSPAGNSLSRTALINYVKSGGRLMVEGGELGYDFRGELDEDFKRSVLHMDEWITDNNAGNLLLKNADHPLASIPNKLPMEITFNNQTGYADKDAIIVDASADIVYEWSGAAGKAGVIVYNNSNDLSAPRIVYFSFSLCSVKDSTTWQAMLENACEYLISGGNTPAGTIEGKIIIAGAPDNSNAVINIRGAGLNRTFTTTEEGSFRFTGLNPGSYRLNVNPPKGYYPVTTMKDGIYVENSPVTGIVFNFEKILPAAISGRITLKDGSGSSGVIVQALGADLRADTTGESGEYHLTNVLPGPVLLKAFKPGYKTERIDTIIQNTGAGLEFNLLMEPGINSYEFDFKDSISGFKATSSWQWGTPLCGPLAPSSGSKLWATNLTGDYRDNDYSQLITPFINLTGFSQATLSFYHWYDMEKSGAVNNREMPGKGDGAFDGGNVKISTDGGMTYKLIHPEGGYPDSIYTSAGGNALAGQLVYSGQSNGWKLAEFALNNYTGSNVIIKFEFASDNTNVRRGWYIDGISIYGHASSDLTAFTVVSKENSAILSWTAGSMAITKGFIIERKTGSSAYKDIGYIKCSENTAGNLSYSFTDSKLSAGPYAYRIKQEYSDGRIGYSKEEELIINPPETFTLKQNYPNPFNPSTKIEYSLPFRSRVRLSVYSITGELVEELADDEQEAGYYLIEFNGSKYASGMYIYRIIAGNNIQIKKMLLIK